MHPRRRIDRPRPVGRPGGAPCGPVPPTWPRATRVSSQLSQCATLATYSAAPAPPTGHAKAAAHGGRDRSEAAGVHDAAQEALGALVLRTAEQLRRRGVLDDLALFEEAHPVGDVTREPH